MALKVLLADDSAAIKKVVQLSLQDYGAEVKAVGSGKDVLDVCRNFRPDIAFVDVLLPHKTGYEVVSEIKKDSALKQTPVVMLWSGFMAFDEGKFKASGADEKLEKPFEVAGLRALITKLVPKMQANPVAKHLEFAKAEFEQPQQPIGAVPPVRPAPAPRVSDSQTPTPTPTPPAPKEEWSMASFDDIGKFSPDGSTGPQPAPKGSAPKSSVPKPGPASDSGPDDSQWVRKELTSKFKVPVPSESEDESTVSFQYSETDIHDTSFLFKAPEGGHASGHGTPNPDRPASDTGTGSGTATEILAPIPPKHDTGAKPPKATVAPPSPHIFEAEIPEIPAVPMTQIDKAAVEKQTREIIERVVWKVVPEIASQIIREEIQRLLGEDK